MLIVAPVLLVIVGLALTILTLRDFEFLSEVKFQFLGVLVILLLGILVWYYTPQSWLKPVLTIITLFPAAPFLAHVVRAVLVRAAEGTVSLDRVVLAPSSSRAEAAERRRDYAEAERLYRQVLDKEPKNPKPRWRLAELLSTGGRYDESMAEYRQLLGLLKAPADKFMAVFEIADILANHKASVPDAIHEIESILEEYPDSSSAPYAHERLGALRQRLSA